MEKLSDMWREVLEALAATLVFFFRWRRSSSAEARKEYESGEIQRLRDDLVKAIHANDQMNQFEKNEMREQIAILFAKSERKDRDDFSAALRMDRMQEMLREVLRRAASGRSPDEPDPRG